MDQHNPSARIHIALTFNDKYWALAYAVMRSICLTTKRRTDLNFHLCHSDLTPAHLAVLEAIPAEFGATLLHHDPAKSPAFQALTADLPTTARFPAIIYTRLLLDKLLPPDVERVLYLDCDTMVCEAIEQFYEIDLQGKTLAAAQDPYHMGIKKGRDVNNGQKPFDSADLYFNSGVLLIDLKAYAAADIPARIHQLAQQGTLNHLYYDQDLLNYIFKDQWLRLDWRYNLINPRRVHESLHPIVIHYTGFSRPWQIFSRAAFARLYRHVMTNAVFYRYMRERRLGRFSKYFEPRNSR
ncbi:MAG TPA: glycosyltransferase [Arsenicitalea sp.]|jgi:lipopolysaccharide biosynthesis glycosyltransferase|nr:glycosyltransferase [Arsenicitalea sp.]